MLPEAEIVRMVGAAEWAERQPPFDAAGRRVLQVELRAGRRVAHVGSRGVHVVVTDDDGVQALER